jgi:uncharacterized protein YggT (Ycf19 family)
MEIDAFFLRNLPYLAVQYLLAAMFWTLIGRFLLQFFFADPNANYIMRFFVRVTNPVYRIFGFITPGFLHPAFLPLYYGFIMLLLRLLFHILMTLAGFAPTLEGVVPVPGQ